MAKLKLNNATKALFGLGAAFAARGLYRQLRRTGLRRKVVCIFGGTRGLGLDLARTLEARGCHVALCARDPDEVARARADVAADGSTVIAEICDATKEWDVRQFIDKVTSRFGEIDIIVTCAATIQVGPADLMSKSDYENALSQIFWSAYVPTMAVLPRMRARKSGHIVHVTSFGGKIAAPHLLPYSTAKFAATGFSSGLRAEVAKDGVHITTIAPGLLRTGAHVNVPVKGQQEKELTWFGLGATLPFVSQSSERAARRIVRAIEHREAEPMMSVMPRVATIAAAIAPGFFSSLMMIQNRLLPSANGGSAEEARAMDVMAESDSPLLHAVDVGGRTNAEQHHEYPGPVSTRTKV